MAHPPDGLLDRGYARVDRLLARAMGGAADPRIAAMGAAERLERLTALRATWSDPALLAYPGGYLREGPPVEPRVTRAVSAAGRAHDLWWPSAYEPWSAEARHAFDAAPANRIAHARWFGDPAGPGGPTVVALHGYGGGRGRVEALLWPIRAWRRAGMEVVFPTLPFHGPRADPARKTPAFPAPDPRFTNEGFRQAVWDVTSLVAHLRRRGRGPIVLAGMSLGGYAAGLLATLVPDLDRLLLVVPLASLADFAYAHGRFGTGETALALREALEAVYRPTSPLGRPPRIAPDRVRVVATHSDGITGIAQAERLAGHFGTSLVRVRGSHALQHHLPWRDLVAFTRG